MNLQNQKVNILQRDLEIPEKIQERIDKTLDGISENVQEGQRGGKRHYGYQKAFRIAAAAVVLAVVVPSSVYAATSYWGIGDFFAVTDHTLTKEARSMIDRDVVQTNDEENSQEMPVDFTVKEVLCDKGSVNIVLEARAKEKGKYLLVGSGYMKSEPISNLGIDEEKTIEEYAESRDLQPLYISEDFDSSSEFSPGSYEFDSVLVDDDILNIYLSARKKSTDKNLDVAVRCTVMGVSKGYNSCSSVLKFKLQDNSQSEKAFYAAKGKMAVTGTKAVITKVEMEKSLVNTYVTVYYRYPKGQEPDPASNNDDDDDGLCFEILNEKGNYWDMQGGSNGNKLDDGTYCSYLTFDCVDLPEKCILEAFDWRWRERHGSTYKKFTITKVK